MDENCVFSYGKSKSKSGSGGRSKGSPKSSSVILSSLPRQRRSELQCHSRPNLLALVSVVSVREGRSCFTATSETIGYGVLFMTDRRSLK